MGLLVTALTKETYFRILNVIPINIDIFFSFFIFKEITTSVVSFNRQDRLRLIGFDSSFDPNIIGQCINQHYQSASIQSQNYCGATEFKLKGYPFHCSGMEAIKTRRLIVKVLVSINKNNN